MEQAVDEEERVMLDDERTGSSHWVFDKRINLTHIITTMSIAASVFVWGSAMDRRVAVLEEKASVAYHRAERQDAFIASGLLELKQEIRETNRKIDRLIEHWSPPR
jgi:hypothetical protein